MKEQTYNHVNIEQAKETLLASLLSDALGVTAV